MLKISAFFSATKITVLAGVLPVLYCLNAPQKAFLFQNWDLVMALSSCLLGLRESAILCLPTEHSLEPSCSTILVAAAGRRQQPLNVIQSDLSNTAWHWWCCCLNLMWNPAPGRNVKSSVEKLIFFLWMVSCNSKVDYQEEDSNTSIFGRQLLFCSGLNEFEFTFYKHTGCSQVNASHSSPDLEASSISGSLF